MTLKHVLMWIIAAEFFTLSLQGCHGEYALPLAWDSVNGADHYNLYYGTNSGVYDHEISCATTNGTVSGLLDGQVYFFAVTTVDPNGLESEFSKELGYAAPYTPNDVWLTWSSPATSFDIFETPDLTQPFVQVATVTGSGGNFSWPIDLQTTFVPTPANGFFKVRVTGGAWIHVNIIEVNQ